MLQYKPKMKDFWHLISMRKQKPMFGYEKTEKLEVRQLLQESSHKTDLHVSVTMIA